MTKDIFKWRKQNARLTVVATILLQFCILITVAEALVYWLPGWWFMEYSRYDVTRFVPGGMSTEDGARVTDEMIRYCVGERDSLDDVTATIAGKSRPFFSDREKLHLVDCRHLIKAFLLIRNIAAAVLVVFVALMAYNRWRAGKHAQKTYRNLVTARMDSTCAEWYLKTIVFTVILMLSLSVICLIDFNAAFNAFHRIFFNNDYWILYPSRDYLIILMREEIFADTAAVIGIIWFIITGILSFISYKHLHIKT